MCENLIWQAEKRKDLHWFHEEFYQDILKYQMFFLSASYVVNFIFEISEIAAAAKWKTNCDILEPQIVQIEFQSH